MSRLARGYVRQHGVASEHKAWSGMRRKCLCPTSDRYASYGGRGIKICPRWASFEVFLEDMGRRPGPNYVLVRIDDDGDYGPDNCLWRQKHGDASHKGTTPEYKAWSSMRARCLKPNHPKYHLYGGRGITVCERWDVYRNFLADMGRRPSSEHSLDRVENDGNYAPDNCRWATRSEQSRNRRPYKWKKLRPVPVTDERTML